MSIQRRTSARGGATPRVDLELAREYARAFGQVRGELGLSDAVSLSGVLSAEGVVSLVERAADLESARGAVGQAEELGGLEEKAMATGASKLYVEDLRGAAAANGTGLQRQ